MRGSSVQSRPPACRTPAGDASVSMRVRCPRLVSPFSEPRFSIDLKELLILKCGSVTQTFNLNGATMIASFRKIIFQGVDLPFACAVLAACLLEAGVNSAPAGVTGDSLTVDATIRVGINPVSLAVTPNGKYLYVTNYGSHTVSVIKTARNKVSDSITLTSGAGGSLSSVAITPDGSTVFVLDAHSTIAVISTSTNTVRKKISAGPSFGTGLAITPDGAHLFVSNFSGTVSIINVASHQIEKTLTVGTETWAVAISPDGKSAYVEADSSGGPFYLTKIDIASQTIVASQLGAGLINGISTALAFSPDSQTVYVPEAEAAVLALNATTGQLENTFVLSSERNFLLGGVQVSPDGLSLYVAEVRGKAIATINTTNGTTVTTSLAGGKHPYPVMISPDGTHLYVASAGTPPDDAKGSVSVFSR